MTGARGPCQGAPTSRSANRIRHAQDERRLVAQRQDDLKLGDLKLGGLKLGGLKLGGLNLPGVLPGLVQHQPRH